MAALEDQLREEFKRVAETVQPGQLRPLRAPAPARIWRRRLIPLAAAAVTAMAIAAARLAGTPSGQQGVVTPPVGRHAALLRHGGRNPHSAEGGGARVGQWPCDRHGHGADQQHRLRLVRYRCGRRPHVRHRCGPRPEPFPRHRPYPLLPAGDLPGRPGQPTELPGPPEGAPLTGMALSPDGTMLALSLEHGFPAGQRAPAPYGSIEVINLVTGASRTWTGPSAPGYWPGAPTWGNGDRTLTFT